MVEVPREIARELAPAEKVLWTGQPRQGLVLRGYDVFALPFGIAWLGVVLLILTRMWRAPHVDPVGPVFSLVFVAAGLYVVVGRFFVEARQRARTFYAVTTERIVIVSGLRSQTVKSIDLKTLSEMALSERRNGSGTIVFGPTSPFDWMSMPGWPGMGSRMTARFEVIPDVRPVYETIRKVQRALST